MSQTAANPLTADTQINWLELARFAAVGQGHQDLGRGVQRLATLAAALHRHTVGHPFSTIKTEKDTQWVHGRTPQASLVAGNGIEENSTDADRPCPCSEDQLLASEDGR